MRKIVGLSSVVFCLIAAPCIAGTEIHEGDAFARADAGNRQWTIGAAAVQMTYAYNDGQLWLLGLQNTLTTPPP